MIRHLVAMILLLGLPLAAAESPETHTPADGIAQRLLDNPPAYYDPTTDTWRQVHLETPSEDTDNAGGGDDTTAMSSIIPMLFYLTVIILLVAALFYAVVLIRRSRSRTHDPAPSRGSVHPAVDLAALPFATVHLGSDPEAALAAAITAGDWSRAVVCLYACQLTALDAQHLIHLHPGKTNRRYLTECSAHDPERGRCLTRTVEAFERVSFGHQELDRTTWDLLAETDGRIRRPASVTA